jgi:hypothetical protein
MTPNKGALSERANGELLGGLRKTYENPRDTPRIVKNNYVSALLGKSRGRSVC